MAVCSVVGDNCRAPAGWRTYRGTAPGLQYRLPRCYGCGLPVCSACSRKVGRSTLCATCAIELVKTVFGYEAVR